MRKEKEQKEKEETKYQISSLLLLLGPFRAFGDIVLFVLPFGLLGHQIVKMLGFRKLPKGELPLWPRTEIWRFDCFRFKGELFIGYRWLAKFDGHPR